MSYTANTSGSHQDELSLVDLAATLVKRKFAFFSILGIVLLLGVTYALLAPARYEYTSLVQLAAQSDGKPLESTAVTLATIQNIWIPELRADHQSLNETNLPFGFEVTVPEGTALIRITSEAQQEHSSLVGTQHQSLIDDLLTHQASIVQREKRLLEGRIEALDQVIDQLPGSPESAVAVASAIERLAKLEESLDALVNPKLVFVGREGAERLAPKRRLIVVLSMVFGCLMGVVGAFCLEFLKAVQAKVNSN